jgi:hypothetical protein
MTRFKPTRRSALLAGLAASAGVSSFGGLSPLTRLAHAGSPAGEPRYYIFCYFGGAWDVLLSLDPRDPGAFPDGNAGLTLIQPGYDLLDLDDAPHIRYPFESPNSNLFVGPFIGDLANLDQQLCIVRGMTSETLTHEAGRRRFLTGKPPSGLQARGSSVATWLASLLGEDDIIPNLAVQVETYNVDLPTYASGMKVNNVPDLVRALEAGPAVLGSLEERQLDELLMRSADCSKARLSHFWQRAEESRFNAQAMVDAQLDTLFDFQGTGSGMAAIRAHYGIAANGVSALQTPEAQAAAAVQAITSGISRVASIRLASSLDTHYDEWTTDQGPIQERGFNAVARMVEALDIDYPGIPGKKWIDFTTIIGFSEFCRGGLINVNSGRDHSLNNACFLIGGNVQGGQVIGASADIGMNPTATDLSTGEQDQGGESATSKIIKPEHILQTLMYDAGLLGGGDKAPEDGGSDPADLRVPPLTAIMKS